MESVITRPGPTAVTFDLSNPTQTTITLPSGSTWSSGLHFHSSHDEYLIIRRGCVRVRRNSTVQTLAVRPGDAPIEIAVPRGVWHEWARAPPNALGPDCSLDQEDVVVLERTDPVDGEKRVFFWNLNGVILQQPPWWLLVKRLWDWWVTLQLFIIFHELDNVPVMLDVKGIMAQARLEAATCKLMGERRVEWWTRAVDERWSLLVLWAASQVGHVLGIRAVRREFTPEEVYKQFASAKKSQRKES
ncbi:hypothetical protein F5Y01DRAFT_296048 [Xylaria sp. FL0043]|nr:hypothetical protein F5Y01DRAFT_296048 [Xylaria sp. FL0043]